MAKATCKSCIFAETSTEEVFTGKHDDEAHSKEYWTTTKRLHCHLMPKPKKVYEDHWCGQHKEKETDEQAAKEQKAKEYFQERVKNLHTRVEGLEENFERLKMAVLRSGVNLGDSKYDD